MKSKRLIRLAIAVFLGFGGISASASELMQECGACHGENGISTRPEVASIAGMSAYYLETSMQVYQEKGRSCPESAYSDPESAKPKTTMCKIAKDLTAQQIQSISAELAALPFVPAKQTTDPALVARGAKLHKVHCDRCHADNGSDPEDDAGILAGQWMEYLRFSFHDFRAGTRPTLEKMQQKMDALSDEDTEALVHFYAAQQ